MKDCMIDLETLGTDPETPVISLGACFFDIDTKQIGPTFYMALDVSEQIARGRKPTGDTIRWWMTQEDAAKKVFHEQAKPAIEVLQLFATWLKANGGGKVNVWGNGATFDVSIMENMCRDYGIKVPWLFYNVMDVRTFRRFMTNNEKIVKSGTAHNALDDAVSQAQFILDNL